MLFLLRSFLIVTIIASPFGVMAASSLNPRRRRPRTLKIVTNNNAAAPIDVSPRALSLARSIDRLPPGDHVLKIVKGQAPAAPWEVEILNEQRVRVFALLKNGRTAAE